MEFKHPSLLFCHHRCECSMTLKPRRRTLPAFRKGQMSAWISQVKIHLQAAYAILVLPHPILVPNVSLSFSEHIKITAEISRQWRLSVPQSNLKIQAIKKSYLWSRREFGVSCSLPRISSEVSKSRFPKAMKMQLLLLVPVFSLLDFFWGCVFL